MKIALDAMGGDFGPPNLVGGAVLALRQYPQIDKLFLVGDTPQIEAELRKNNCNDRRIEIVHSTQVVAMSDGAVQSVRRKKDSSVSRAVDLVKKGEAAAIVSAGHTGAAVAATTIKLRTLPGIDRPGIAALFPSETNIFVLIDAGANSDARPEHLLQYGIMGSVYSRHVLGYKNPSIGLMSIGGEDVKGTDLTKEVFKMLKRSELNFRGNIEGHDLFAHPVEVVVCDGFVGNVAIKTCEGTAKLVSVLLREALKSTVTSQVGALLSRRAFNEFKKGLDYSEYGGAPLLGVRGVCIVGHGSSNEKAVMNGIRVAAEFAQAEVNSGIESALRNH
jgi:glycerol-3-phosphate acyltransferase PlsX